MAEGTSVQELSLQGKNQIHQEQNSLPQQERDIFEKMHSYAILFKKEDADTKDRHTSEFVDFLDTLNANKTVLEKTITSDSLDDVDKSLDILAQFFSSADEYYISFPSDDDPRPNKQKDIKDLMISEVNFLYKHMGRLEEILNKNPNWELMNKLLKINIFLSDADGNLNKQTEVRGDVDFLLRNIDKAMRMASQDLHKYTESTDLARVFKTIFDFGDSSQIQKAKQIAANLLKDRNPDVRKVISYSIYSREEAGDILSSVFGIDGEKAVTAWGNGNISLLMDSFPKNLLYLWEIEQKKPGIANILQKEFGINNFARYPQELLIRQYEQKDIKDNLPYGVVIYPQSDYNGAFFQKSRLLEKLSGQLEGKYRLRVWEVESVLALVGALNKSRHRYGPVSFAIIGGHGSSEKIEFGRSVKEDPIGLLGSAAVSTKSVLDQKKHIARNSAFSVRSAFIKNPTIILSSCSTGQLGGIGQEISRVAGAKVIAPPEPISTRDINAEISPDGIINFEVEYDKQEVSPQIYHAGILQNPKTKK